MAASGRQGAAAALGRVRAQPRGAHPLPLLVHRGAGDLRGRRRGDDGTPADHRRHALDGGGARHAARRPRPPGRRRPDLHGAGRRQRQRRHDHPERAGVRGRRGRHVLHGPAQRPADRPRRRSQPVVDEVGIGSVAEDPDDGQGLRRRRGDEVAPRRGREGVLHARRRGDQHRDDLHLADQDLLRRARRRGRAGGARAARAPSSSARRTSAPSTRSGRRRAYEPTASPSSAPRARSAP